jgi:hypothetical protein
VDFTEINISIIIGITGVNHDNVVFTIHIIFKIDITITIGIEVNNDFNSNFFNIITIPSTDTSWTWSEWLFTGGITIFWAVFISPFVFTKDNTVEDFTFSESSVHVDITVFVEDI